MVLRTLHPQVTAHGLTDTGLVRQNNEDEWGTLDSAPLWVVADGMGGHQAGEIAAREAVAAFLSTVREFLEAHSQQVLLESEALALFKESFDRANQRVFGLGQTNDLLHGMGTTLSALMLCNGYVVIGHVGDSRIYRLREGSLLQLTVDHSLLRELVALGKLSQQEADDFIYKNIITRAIGTEQSVDPMFTVESLASGDTFLLCSDGLTDLLDCSDLQAILMRSWTIEEKVRSLIALAKQRGGYDNITAVIVQPQEENVYASTSE